MSRLPLWIIAGTLVLLTSASVAVTVVGFTSTERTIPSVESWVHECVASCGHHPVLDFHYVAESGATCTCGK